VSEQTGREWGIRRGRPSEESFTPHKKNKGGSRDSSSGGENAWGKSIFQSKNRLTLGAMVCRGERGKKNPSAGSHSFLKKRWGI